MGVCLLYSTFPPPGEYLLYSKVSGGKVYYVANIQWGNVCYIVNIPGEGLLYDTGIVKQKYKKNEKKKLIITQEANINKVHNILYILPHYVRI